MTHRSFACLCLSAALFMGSPVKCSANDIHPGLDLFVTTPNTVSTYDFAATPDQFGPNSDPSIYPDFEVRVEPPIKSPYTPPEEGMSLILQRTSLASLPTSTPPSQAVVPIEIVTMNLFSVDPIVVTYNGGQNAELWDVQINASATAQNTGTMSVLRDQPDGGQLTLSLSVQPRLTFTRQRDGQQITQDGPPIETLTTTTPVPWSYSQPEDAFLLVDPIGGLLQSNFWPGATPGDPLAAIQPIVLESDGLTLSVTVVPVPEPSTLLAVACGILLLARVSRTQ